MGKVSVFQGLKGQGRGGEHPTPCSAEVKERVELYFSSLSGSWALTGWTSTFTLHFTCKILPSAVREMQFIAVFTRPRYCLCPHQEVLGSTPKNYFNIIHQDIECGPVLWAFSDLGFCLAILHLYHVWGTGLRAGKPRVRFLMVSLEFFIDIILSVALWPWGRFRF